MFNIAIVYILEVLLHLFQLFVVHIDLLYLILTAFELAQNDLMDVSHLKVAAHWFFVLVCNSYGRDFIFSTSTIP